MEYNFDFYIDGKADFASENWYKQIVSAYEDATEREE